MSSDLKPCPLPDCGGVADSTYPVSDNTDWVGCSRDGCPLNGAPMPRDAWQSLPRVSDTTVQEVAKELRGYAQDIDEHDAAYLSPNMLTRLAFRLELAAEPRMPVEVWVCAQGIFIDVVFDVWAEKPQRYKGKIQCVPVHGAAPKQDEYKKKQLIICDECEKLLTVEGRLQQTQTDLAHTRKKCAAHERYIKGFEQCQLDCNLYKKPEQWEALHEKIVKLEEGIEEGRLRAQAPIEVWVVCNVSSGRVIQGFYRHSDAIVSMEKRRDRLVPYKVFIYGLPDASAGCDNCKKLKVALDSVNTKVIKLMSTVSNLEATIRQLNVKISELELVALDANESVRQSQRETFDARVATSRVRMRFDAALRAYEGASSTAEAYRALAAYSDALDRCHDDRVRGWNYATKVAGQLDTLRLNSLKNKVDLKSTKSDLVTSREMLHEKVDEMKQSGDMLQRRIQYLEDLCIEWIGREEDWQRLGEHTRVEVDAIKHAGRYLRACKRIHRVWKLAREEWSYCEDENGLFKADLKSAHVRIGELEKQYKKLHEGACERADKIEALILQYVLVGPDDTGDAIEQLGKALSRLIKERDAALGEVERLKEGIREALNTKGKGWIAACRGKLHTLLYGEIEKDD